MPYQNNALHTQESLGKNSRRILIIEETESLAILYKSILLQNEYQILTATSGQETLALFDSFQPELIITHDQLSDMDSDQLRRSVSIQSGETYVPILVLSIQKGARFCIPSPKINRHETLFLPFRIKDLRSSVQRLLGDQEPSNWNFYYPSNPEPSPQRKSSGAQVGFESYV